MSKVVVKVQMPWFSSDGNMTKGLVYDIDRRHQVEQVLPPNVRKHIRSLPQPKAFYMATWNAEKNAWDLHEVTRDCKW